MISSGARYRIKGFTLVEALVATALMALVLAALATITSQWLPNWNRGFAQVQRNERLAIGLQRIISDIAASEFIPPNGRTMHPLFEGTPSSVILVRSAIGPNPRPGLEIIRFAASNDARGPILTRSRAPFTPGPPQTSPVADRAFADPAVLVLFPYQVSFSYAGRDRIWRDVWHDADQLPSAVRISVRNITDQRLLPVSTAVALHVDTPARCSSRSAAGDCARADVTTAVPAGNATPGDSPQQIR